MKVTITENQLIDMVSKCVRRILEASESIESKAERIANHHTDKIPVVYAVDYVPKSAKAHPNQKEKNIQELIWSFKNDTDNYNVPRVTRSRNLFKNWFVGLMRKTFTDEERQNLVLIGIPAHSKEATIDRWEEFIDMTSRESGMINGQRYVKIENDAVPSHFGGGGEPQISFDGNYLNGKSCVLIDDLITQGRHMDSCSKELEDVGAKVLMGAVLGKTIEHD